LLFFSRRGPQSGPQTEKKGMECSVHHLIKRNGIYYFRYRCPVKYLPGKNLEIKVSLRTDDLKKAVTASKLASEKLRSLIDSGVASMISVQEIRNRIGNYIRESLEGQERHFAGFGRICDGTRDDARESMLALSRTAEQALENNDLEAPWARNTANDLLKDLAPDEADLNMATREFMRATLYLARVQRECLEGARFTGEFSESDFQTVLSGKYPKAHEIIEADHYDTLGKLVEMYLASPHQWGIKMADDVKNSLVLLCQHFGKDIDIRKISKREIRNFRDNILMKIPARRNILPKYKGMTLAQWLDCKDAEKLAPRSVNHNLMRISGLFTWCVEGDYVVANPVSGLQLSITGKASNERSIYSTEELVKIFSLLREDKLNAWAPFKLWISLIMLYCGSRQNEACQLFTNNIILSDGILCFEFTESEETGARVKNDSSMRITPIHPVLLQLGFLDYVLKRKFDRRNRGNTPAQLWPQLGYNPKDGYARRYRIFFEDFNRKYITQDPKKSCYSLRHNFTDNLKQQGIPEFIVSELDGHSEGKRITYNRYGKALNVDVKQKTMLKLNFGFDIFEVLGKKPLSDEEIKRQVEQLFKV